MFKGCSNLKVSSNVEDPYTDIWQIPRDATTENGNTESYFWCEYMFSGTGGNMANIGSPEIGRSYYVDAPYFSVPDKVSVDGLLIADKTRYGYLLEINSPNGIKGVVVVALYGNDKKLIGCATEYIDTANKNFYISASINSETKPWFYRIMLWDGLGNIKPLCMPQAKYL